MSNFEQDPILIPEGSVPVAAGTVTAVLEGAVEVTEDAQTTTVGFISNGENGSEVFGILVEMRRHSPNSIVLRLDEDPETKRVVRSPVSLGEAKSILEYGTPNLPGVVDLVVVEQRKLRIDTELTPTGTDIGDKLGVWVDPNIQATLKSDKENPLAVGHMAITAVVKLP